MMYLKCTEGQIDQCYFIVDSIRIKTKMAELEHLLLLLLKLVCPGYWVHLPFCFRKKMVFYRILRALL